MNHKFEPITVELETNEGDNTYTGIHNPAWKYKGFIMPYFDLATAKKILSDWYEQCHGSMQEQAKEWGFSYYELDEVHDAVIEIIYYDGKISDINTDTPVIHNGQKYYGIANGNWEWKRARKPQPEEENDANYEDLAHLAFYGQNL